MLKITPIKTSGATKTLKLEGRLLGPWVEEVRRACAGSVLASPLSLDLSGLVFADADGERLLKDLLRDGVAISGCSGFVETLLQRDKL